MVVVTLSCSLETAPVLGGGLRASPGRSGVQADSFVPKRSSQACPVEPLESRRSAAANSASSTMLDHRHKQETPRSYQHFRVSHLRAQPMLLNMVEEEVMTDDTLE
jgi:hypothetical protein